MKLLLLLRHRHRLTATNVASQPAWPYPPQPHQALEHAWIFHSGINICDHMYNLHDE